MEVATRPNAPAPNRDAVDAIIATCSLSFAVPHRLIVSKPPIPKDPVDWKKLGF
jgi:hypothetical protein